MPDLTDALDEITETVSRARALPMSASCVLNRADLLAALEQLRAKLPEAVVEARAVIGEREAVVGEGHAKAEQLLTAAEAERATLIDESSIVVAAQARADALLAEATATCASMRGEVDDYVDGKLANFEVVLSKTLAAVERGRTRLAGRHDLDHLAGVEPDPAD